MDWVVRKELLFAQELRRTKRSEIKRVESVAIKPSDDLIDEMRRRLKDLRQQREELCSQAKEKERDLRDLKRRVTTQENPKPNRNTKSVNSSVLTDYSVQRSFRKPASKEPKRVEIQLGQTWNFISLKEKQLEEELLALSN